MQTNGGTLQLSLALNFNFTGVKTVYMNASGKDGLNAGWRKMGTWTAETTGKPAIVSVSPINSSGSPQTFRLQYSDPNGAADLADVYVLFNSTLSAVNACYVSYYPKGNLLYLRNDTGTAWLNPILAGSSGIAANGQCTINGSGSSGVLSGSILTLELSVTFAGGLTASQNVYMNATELGGLYSGWMLEGTWTP